MSPLALVLLLACGPRLQPPEDVYGERPPCRTHIGDNHITLELHARLDAQVPEELTPSLRATLSWWDAGSERVHTAEVPLDVGEPRTAALLLDPGPGRLDPSTLILEVVEAESDWTGPAWELVLHPRRIPGYGHLDGLEVGVGGGEPVAFDMDRTGHNTFELPWSAGAEGLELEGRYRGELDIAECH